MIELPGHFYIAVGAITAAIIAGVFSYFNLVTSKETKISEFRQNWINDLRKDITTYVSSMQSLETFENYINDHLEDKIKDLDIVNKRAELHDAALSAYNSIHLKINKNEKNKKAKEVNDNFLQALDEAHENRKAGETEDIGYLLEQVISNAEALLKREWNRVRDGEKSYRWSKNGALLFLIVTMIVFISVVFYIVTYNPNNRLDNNINKPNQESISSSHPKQSIEATKEKTPNKANSLGLPKAAPLRSAPSGSR